MYLCSMYFVYLLSYNGIPFYVGITKCLVSRYVHHYTIRDCNSFDHLNYIRQVCGQYADITPIHYCTSKHDAAILETIKIKELCSNNIMLSNRMHNKPYNRIRHDIQYSKPTKFPASLKHTLIDLQKQYILLYEQRQTN